MANTKLLFIGENQDTSLECLCFKGSRISFTIKSIDTVNTIILDRDTVIKLSKTIKSEISKMIY